MQASAASAAAETDLPEGDKKNTERHASLVTARSSNLCPTRLGGRQSRLPLVSTTGAPAFAYSNVLARPADGHEQRAGTRQARGRSGARGSTLRSGTSSRPTAGAGHRNASFLFGRGACNCLSLVTVLCPVIIIQFELFISPTLVRTFTPWKRCVRRAVQDHNKKRDDVNKSRNRRRRGPSFAPGLARPRRPAGVLSPKIMRASSASPSTTSRATNQWRSHPIDNSNNDDDQTPPKSPL